MRTDRYRIDIQILRAIAILLVLLFHAQVPGLSGGFLGVDIFLVISGYLITGLIARAIHEERFFVADFYLNRAKRLLPASLTTYLVVSFASLWLLTDVEIQRFADTLAGALTFTSNFVLWQSTDYFGSDAKLNVLLHTWSLSLEEQFYLLVPFAMIHVPRRYWLPVAATGMVLSFLLCAFLVMEKPVASFYLLPTRAWELLAGSALALHEKRLRELLRNWGASLGPLAIGVLIIVPIAMPFEQLGFAHPSLDALCVAAATAVIILVRPTALNQQNLVNSVGVWVGNISYSLYLVHWPIFAFAKNAYFGGEAPPVVRLGLALFSVALAAVLHTAIERPVHRMSLGHVRWRSAMAFCAGTVAVWLVSSSIASLRESPRHYEEIMRPNYGLSKSCELPGAFVSDPSCRTDGAPEIVLWGDSFAMHVAGALPAAGFPFVQATMSGCAPVLGVAQVNPAVGQDKRWAVDCIRFNQKVLEFIDENPDITTVIMASQFSQVLGVRPNGFGLHGGTIEPVALDREGGIARYVETVKKLVTSGRRVVIVGPTPSVGVNMAECVGRREMGLPVLGPHANCEISRREAEGYRALALQLIGKLKQIDGVKVVNLFDVLCDDLTCPIMKDDVIMYRDAGHISNAGAKYIREKNLLLIQ